MWVSGYACVCKSEDNFLEWVLFYHMGSEGYQLGSKLLHPLWCLAGPPSVKARENCPLYVLQLNCSELLENPWPEAHAPRGTAKCCEDTCGVSGQGVASTASLTLHTRLKQLLPCPCKSTVERAHPVSALLLWPSGDAMMAVEIMGTI